MSSPRPVTVVEELLHRLGPRLDDISLPMSRSELRRALADLRGAQRDAQAEQRGALFNAIGLLCLRLGDLTGALDAFRNAARYAPAAAYCMIGVAASLIELGRFQQALDALREGRARPQKRPEFEFIALLNTSEAHYGLGDVAAARLAFERAHQQADPASRADAFKLATQAAIIGMEDDAVEFFAHYAALAQGAERGESPAIEVIREAPEELKARLAELPPLAAAIERAMARWDAPTPREPPIDPMDAPFDDEPDDPPEEAARTAEARAQVARRETMSTDELLRSLGL